MTNLELARSIRSGFFADRPTLNEAMEYAESVFNSFGSNSLAATVALQVVLNTLSNEMIKNEETKMEPFNESDVGC